VDGALGVNDVMRRDIWSQPEALRAAVPDLRAQAESLDPDPRWTRIVLTGSGDSFIAALAVEELYRLRQPLASRVVPALDAARYVRWTENDVAVIVSVSGEVSRAIETARAAAGRGATTIAITAAPESTLARTSSHRLVIPSPIDRSIPHSRDYTLTLAALAVLLERLSGAESPELDRWPDLVASFFSALFEAPHWAPPTSGRTWFLGAGPDRATAMYGALKFWEAAGLRAWWDDLEEFAHGSQLMAAPGDRAILIASGAGVTRAIEMQPGLRQMGLLSVLVTGDSVDVPHRLAVPSLGGPEWHPFSACLPLQQLAYVDATRRGLDVSIPLHGQGHGPDYDRVHVEWTKRSALGTGLEESRQ
jgi:glucosamine--fructose-6-phosphate aminotransferase (isomerizing)